MLAPAQSPGSDSLRIASSPHPSQFSKSLTLARRGGKEGPKWNCRGQRRRFSIHSTLATRHCFSNRNTSKLELPVTHTKQSSGQFLIATFRALARRAVGIFQPAHRPSPAPALIVINSVARKLEILLTRSDSATSKFLIDNFCRLVGTAAFRHLAPVNSLFVSDRHTYGKLELLVSYTKQAPRPISNRHKNALHPRCAFHNLFRGELI